MLLEAKCIVLEQDNAEKVFLMEQIAYHNQVCKYF